MAGAVFGMWKTALNEAAKQRRQTIFRIFFWLFLQFWVACFWKKNLIHWTAGSSGCPAWDARRRVEAQSGGLQCCHKCVPPGWREEAYHDFVICLDLDLFCLRLIGGNMLTCVWFSTLIFWDYVTTLKKYIQTEGMFCFRPWLSFWSVHRRQIKLTILFLHFFSGDW